MTRRALAGAVVALIFADNRWGSLYTCLPCIKVWRDECDSEVEGLEGQKVLR